MYIIFYSRIFLIGLNILTKHLDPPMFIPHAETLNHHLNTFQSPIDHIREEDKKYSYVQELFYLPS